MEITVSVLGFSFLSASLRFKWHVSDPTPPNLNPYKYWSYWLRVEGLGLRRIMGTNSNNDSNLSARAGYFQL